jgi:hypothetical protein
VIAVRVGVIERSVMGVFRRSVVGVLAGVVLVLVVGVSPAFAGSVWWGLTSGSRPTNLAPGGRGQVVVTAQDRGNADVNGTTSPVVLRDTLPAGLKIVKIGGVEVEGVAGQAPSFTRNRGPVACSALSPREAECVFDAGTIPAFEELEVRISVEVVGGHSGELNTVSVSGGGAVGTSTVSHAVSVGQSNGFGIEAYELLPEEEGGGQTFQAGAHPYQLTTVLDLNTSVLGTPREQEPAAMTKDLHFRLPPGLIGNPTPFPQCTDEQFSKEENGNSGHNECVANTAIGVATETFSAPGVGGFTSGTVPVFNLVPLAGEPARFGFEVGGTHVTIDISVRAGSDYGVTASVTNITQAVGFLDSKVTLWGVPGAGVHDGQRGWGCVGGGEGVCNPAGETSPPPFLSMPTSCTGPLGTTVAGDSWFEPKPADPPSAEYTIGGLDGCNHLPFTPSLSVLPDVSEASSASGLTIGAHLRQDSVLNAEGLAESALKELVIDFPAGVTVNPADAEGLESCSEQQIGYLPGSSVPGDLQFTPAEPSCPNGSKIGRVEIETPLLPNALKGYVYLATPEPFGENGPLGIGGLNPFGSLLALYVVARDPVSGTLVKAPVQVELDPRTGRLTATSQNIPELAFETLRLYMFGGERSPLATPGLCGTYTTLGSFTPWSGEPAVLYPAAFQIKSGRDGGACHDPLPFAPSLTAGTTSIQAGGYSPFTMTMSREDGNQDLKAISLHMPAGLSGTLTGIPLCGETQGNAGTCPAASQIGETTVSVGVGSSPYTVTGGKVYLTGPYEGAPFGLSIVNPANAGPFHLGVVVVRAKIEVNPLTAQLTVTSDAQEPYAIPQFIDGIPLQIKHVNVTIGRPGFTFNPTNCTPMAITGSLTSIEGATQTLAVPFQATNCAVLKFTPKLEVSTSAKTSKADGASLTAKVIYPSAPQGTQANIAKVKVDLPKQLPSRLTTLQKACTTAQFEANAAGCPSPSVIGHAKAVVPNIPVPLEGPAIFVSHGGEAFPSLEIVLQGYGVKVDLVGTTFISKAGITSTTFKAVPDNPVGSFELTLPEGRYSALAANGNLCKAKLRMPTAFLAQNGAEIHETTNVNVTGCPKVKKASKHKQKHKGKGKGGKSKKQ